MAKPELGSKRVCVSCSATFFDLMRDPAVCPKCATPQPPQVPKMRSRSGGNTLAVTRKPKAPAPVDRDADADNGEAEAEGTPASDDDLDEEAGTIPEEIDIEGAKDNAER